MLAGLVFAALNQALVGWFGGVGRFVSVVLVVLTAAGAITSAVPVVFDSITPLLPLTPALEGLRAVAAGAGTGGGAAALLVAWLVVGLAAAVLATARRRVVRAPAARPGRGPLGRPGSRSELGSRRLVRRTSSLRSASALARVTRGVQPQPRARSVRIWPVQAGPSSQTGSSRGRR